MKKRCAWVNSNPLMISYHDKEWGVPIHDDQKLFEFLILETFQAGLSWEIVLNKRDNFRKAFKEFDPQKVASINTKYQKKLTEDAGIIRNKQKIAAAINNAVRFLEIQKEFGSFDKYIWRFVDNTPIQNKFSILSDLPATSSISDKISSDMKSRGFKFVGSTVIYAHMQATGMVNDHTLDCFRYNEVISKSF